MEGVGAEEFAEDDYFWREAFDELAKGGVGVAGHGSEGEDGFRANFPGKHFIFNYQCGMTRLVHSSWLALRSFGEGGFVIS